MSNKGTYDKNYYNEHKEQFKKNSLKYQSKQTNLSIKVKPDLAEKLHACAKKAEMPLRAFMLKAMEEKIERDGLNK